MTDPLTVILVFIAATCMVGGAIVGGIIMSVRASNATAPVHHRPGDDEALESRGSSGADAEPSTADADADADAGADADNAASSTGASDGVS